LLAGGAAVGAGVLRHVRVAQAQTKPKFVATLVLGTPMRPSPQAAEEMRSHGWIEGETIRFERRGAGRRDELPAIAAEIVALKPDLVVTWGMPAALAMKKATSTIPVIFNLGDDPVEAGIVASFARPGGNLTGFYNGRYEGKKLELIKEIQPGTRVVVYPVKAIRADVAHAAQGFGLQARAIDMSGEQDLERFFAELRGTRADAVVLPLLDWLRQPLYARIAAEFLTMKMPALAGGRSFTSAGGLLSFGPKDLATRGMRQFDQILRGANPAEIPVESPREFDLVINLNTAKAFGLKVPPPLRLRADELIGG
jgi:putative ABC transport system substrate-binding protein